MALWLLWSEHVDTGLTEQLETYELAAEGGAWRVVRATAAESMYCFPGFPLFLQCLNTDFISWALNVSTPAQIIFAASEEREKCENRQFWNQVRERLWQLLLELLGNLKQEEGIWDFCWKTEAILFPVIYDPEAGIPPFCYSLASTCMSVSSINCFALNTPEDPSECVSPPLSCPPA